MTSRSGIIRTFYPAAYPARIPRHDSEGAASRGGGGSMRGGGVDRRRRPRAAAGGGPRRTASLCRRSPQPSLLAARPGARIRSFGDDGIVDLKVGAVFGREQPIDLVTGEIGVHSTAAITRDGVVMVGSAFLEGGTPKTHNNTKGLVRGFDVRTGKRLWTFNTIPRPGEVGNDTWLNESWAVTGNVGVWNQMAVDEDLGVEIGRAHV